MSEVLGKKVPRTTSVKLLVQRIFLLASQEAIFNKPQFFSYKNQLRLTGPSVRSSVEWGEGELGLFSLVVKMA